MIVWRLPILDSAKGSAPSRFTVVRRSPATELCTMETTAFQMFCYKMTKRKVIRTKKDLRGLSEFTEVQEAGKGLKMGMS